MDTTDGELQAGLVRPRLLRELLLRAALAARLAALSAAVLDLARHGCDGVRSVSRRQHVRRGFFEGPGESGSARRRGPARRGQTKPSALHGRPLAALSERRERKRVVLSRVFGARSVPRPQEQMVTLALTKLESADAGVEGVKSAEAAPPARRPRWRGVAVMSTKDRRRCTLAERGSRRQHESEASGFDRPSS